MGSALAIHDPSAPIEDANRLLAGLADDLAEGLDPVRFVEKAGFHPHDYQRAVLRSRSKRIILNWSRQAGKSTVTSWLPLHKATFYPGSTTLILGPGERQAKLLLDKVYEALDLIGRDAIPVEVDNVLELRLKNGSKIVALPGKEGTVRGYTADLIVIDESSKVADSLYKTVRPMVAATDGAIVLLGTPFGKRGFFFDIFTGRSSHWERHEVPVHRVPHISAAFIEEERTELGERWFGQEYLCQFLELEGAVFTLDQIARALSDTTVEPRGLFSVPATNGPLSDPSVQPRIAF